MHSEIVSQFRSPDDVLRYMAEEVERRGDRPSVGVDVDLTSIYSRMGPGDNVRSLIIQSSRLGWIDQSSTPTFDGNRVFAFTARGIARLGEVRFNPDRLREAQELSRALADRSVRRLRERIAEARNAAAPITAGSRLSLLLSKAVRDEAAERAKEVLTNFSSALGQPSEELRAVFVNEVAAATEEMLRISRAEFMTHLEKGRPLSKPWDEVCAEISDEVVRDAKHDAQLRSLLADVLPAPSGNVMTFHGPVGAVQTGDRASATVNQPSAALNVDLPRLTALLDQLLLHLDELQDASPEALSAARSFADDIRTEALTPAPNRTRLWGMLNALSLTVQTLGAVPGVIETVTLVGTALGFVVK